MLKQALNDEVSSIVEEIIKEYPHFNTIFLDDWRGKRLIYDSAASINCKNECNFCPHQKILGIQGKIIKKPIEFALLEWEMDKDKKYYGPEKYLPCKSSSRYAECFIKCIMDDEDLKDCKNLNEELDLVKNITVVWAKPNLNFKEIENVIKKKIITSILNLSKENNFIHYNNIVQILINLRWDFFSKTFR